MSELVIETAGKIVTVTIDRPPVNALTIALYGQITDAFENGQLDQYLLKITDNSKLNFERMAASYSTDLILFDNKGGR